MEINYLNLLFVMMSLYFKKKLILVIKYLKY